MCVPTNAERRRHEECIASEELVKLADGLLRRRASLQVWDSAEIVPFTWRWPIKTLAGGRCCSQERQIERTREADSVWREINRSWTFNPTASTYSSAAHRHIQSATSGLPLGFARAEDVVVDCGLVRLPNLDVAGSSRRIDRGGRSVDPMSSR